MTQKYRPGTGTEGADFFGWFCDRCQKEREHRETENNPCDILSRTFAHEIDDPNYPTEWVHAEGGPICTSFEPEHDNPPRCEKTIDLFTGGSHG